MFQPVVCQLIPAQENPMSASFLNSGFSDRCHFGTLKLAMVAVFTPWQLANAISQHFIVLFSFHC